MGAEIDLFGVGCDILLPPADIDPLFHDDWAAELCGLWSVEPVRHGAIAV